MEENELCGASETKIGVQMSPKVRALVNHSPVLGEDPGRLHSWGKPKNSVNYK